MLLGYKIRFFLVDVLVWISYMLYGLVLVERFMEGYEIIF